LNEIPRIKKINYTLWIWKGKITGKFNNRICVVLVFLLDSIKNLCEKTIQELS
jgi:hypothetical protein